MCGLDDQQVGGRGAAGQDVCRAGAASATVHSAIRPRWSHGGVAVLSLRIAPVGAQDRPGHVSAVTQLMSACWGGTWSVCLSSTMAWALLQREQRFGGGAQRWDGMGLYLAGWA